MKLSLHGINFAVDTVWSGEEPLPFSVKVVDLNQKVAVDLPQECIGVQQCSTPDKLIAVAQSTGIWNLVQFAPNEIGQRLYSGSRLIQNPAGFLEHPSNELLASDDVAGTKLNERRWLFRSSNQKMFILNMVKKYLMNVPGAKPISEAVCYVADELFTNALYNAPFVDTDYSLARSTAVFVDPKLSAELIISNSKDRLFIGCVDYFGSFDCEDFLKSTSKAFSMDVENILKMSVGGAGLGMLRIIDLAPIITIAVEKGKRTLVGCTFPLNLSLREVRQSLRHFYFQSFESLETPILSLRVERRGTKVLCRCAGTLGADAPVKEIDFTSVSELDFDLRLLQDFSSENLTPLFATLESIKSLKTISFNYVPYFLLSKLVKVLSSRHNEMFKIRSVWHSTNCSACHNDLQVIFKSLPEGQTTVGNDVVKCPSCHSQIDDAQKMFASRSA